MKRMRNPSLLRKRLREFLAISIAAASCVALNGCAARLQSPSNKKPGMVSRLLVSAFKILPKPKNRPPKATEPVQIGSVAMVSLEDRFVLINIQSLAISKEGTEAISVGEGRTTGKLRLSRERNYSFVVADILEGTPQLGDKVFLYDATLESNTATQKHEDS